MSDKRFSNYKRVEKKYELRDGELVLKTVDVRFDNGQDRAANIEFSYVDGDLVVFSTRGHVEIAAISKAEKLIDSLEELPDVAREYEL